MEQIQKQHQLAMTLLDILGLTNIRLERKPDSSYRYYAWSVPLVDGNGSPRISRQGLVRQQQQQQAS